MDLNAQCFEQGFYVGKHGLYTIGNHPSGESKENRWTRGAHAAYFMDLLEHDRVNVRDLITHRTPAADAPNLYPKLLADRTSYLGVVLEW